MMEQIMGYELLIYFRWLWAESLPCLALGSLRVDWIYF